MVIIPSLSFSESNAELSIIVRVPEFLNGSGVMEYSAPPIRMLLFVKVIMVIDGLCANAKFSVFKLLKFNIK